MDAEQIVKLTLESVRDLIETHKVDAFDKDQRSSGRREERWPFPGTVETWLPESCYGDRHMLATLHNLSLHGLAMRTRTPIPIETRISLAIHLPALSAYGHAVVRHCTRAHVGYLVGVEFLFPTDDEDDAA